MCVLQYEGKSDSEEEIEQQLKMAAGSLDGSEVGGEGQGRHVIGLSRFEDPDYLQLAAANVESGDEDDEWWNEHSLIQGVKVQIYFTRNSKIIGMKKDVRIPKGGFYPTIGMMSSKEKVRVDLRPLSG